MKIFICDDSKSDIMRLRHFLETYATENGCTFQVKAFLRSKDMLNAFEQEEELPSLVFCDIYMEEMDGMETAKIIRKKNGTIPIIFTTSSQDHALEAFQMNADGYIHKPYTRKEFEFALKKVESVFVTQEKKLTVRVERADVSIPIKNIVYVESDNHKLILHCKQIEYTTRLSMTRLMKELQEDTYFIPYGKSYLLNLKYVSHLEQGCIYLFDGTTISIPIRQRKAVETTILSYLAGDI